MVEEAEGRLAQNLTYFARALREAGMPIGPGLVIEAITALEAVGLGNRHDFKTTLHSVLVKRHEQTIVFDQAFEIFWKRRGFMEKLISMMSPMAPPKNAKKQKADAGATRVADALLKQPPPLEKPAPSLDLDARFTLSSHEVLQSRDFAQMSAAEIAEAEAAIARLRLPQDDRLVRRMRSSPAGDIIDPRATFRRSMRSGGAIIDLGFRERKISPPPIVALCDISGSMSDYTRVFLHFLHILASQRAVHSFLFGTRLTNVTRDLRARDIDAALAACSSGVKDWSGGTRIGASLHLFNRHWARRVLGQGAIVLLFTDGLERPDSGMAGPDLGHEMDRLHRSCRRLVWVNPLLRFDGFEARAQGIRAILPHVDEFRPIHNLNSMSALCSALGPNVRNARDLSPAFWLNQV